LLSAVVLSTAALARGDATFDVRGDVTDDVMLQVDSQKYSMHTGEVSEVEESRAPPTQS